MSPRPEIAIIEGLKRFSFFVVAIWGRLVCLGPRDQPYSTAAQKSGIWFFLRIDKYNSVEQPVE